MTFEQLQNEMIKSMKEKNRVKKEVIADIITCAKNIAISQKQKDNISDDIVIAAILKSKKICQEQIDTCPQSRPDLLEGYNLCMGYINELAPPMMSETEIYNFVISLANSYSDEVVLTKGILMPILTRQLKGKADGKLINKVVTEVLKNR